MGDTKQKVFDSAVSLFHTNGYSGTSIRDIAKKADVNVSLISYYFGGKKGLLESMIITFLEGYIEQLDEEFKLRHTCSSKECFLGMIKRVLTYHSEQYQLARLILREITLDSLLVREIMTTYLSKEKYYFKNILETGVQNREFKNLPIALTITQLKGMLIMPYLHPQYMVEVMHFKPNEPYFAHRYYREISRWIEHTLIDHTNQKQVSGKMIMM